MKKKKKNRERSRHYYQGNNESTGIVTFVDIVFVIFVGTVFVEVFVTFVDTLSTTFIISSHAITESSRVLSKYLLYSQIHVLEFQL